MQQGFGKKEGNNQIKIISMAKDRKEENIKRINEEEYAKGYSTIRFVSTLCELLRTEENKFLKEALQEFVKKEVVPKLIRDGEFDSIAIASYAINNNIFEKFLEDNDQPALQVLTEKIKRNLVRSINEFQEEEKLNKKSGKKDFQHGKKRDFHQPHTKSF